MPKVMRMSSRVNAGQQHAIFHLLNSTDKRAQVDITINDRIQYRLSLQNPFGNVWYITGVGVLN